MIPVPNHTVAMLCRVSPVALSLAVIGCAALFLLNGSEASSVCGLPLAGDRLFAATGLALLGLGAVPEAQLSRVFDAAPDAIVVSGQDQKIVLVNREAETLFGYPRDELVGTDVTLLTSHATRAGLVEVRRNIFSLADPGHEIGERESMARRRDGTEFPVAVRFQITELGGMKVIVAAIRDSTARREAERRVAESEARFRALIETAPDAILVSELDGMIRVVNAATETMLGYRRGQLIGMAVTDIIAAERRAKATENRRKLIARAQAGGDPIDQRESVAHTHDGREFPVALRQTVTIVDGRLMVFSVLRDISEQRAAQQQIVELNERLKRDNAALAAVNSELEAFSYSVSHDLRTPLRAIDGFSQALVEDCADRLDETGLSHLARIRGATQRMGLLIDDLLKLARVTRSELNVGDVNLSAIAGEIARELREGTPERQAEIAIAQDMNVRGDPRLMRVALENLLSNAWKFTAGREPARIEFGRNGVDGENVYYVRDNGAGFDMAYASKLFGAFQRLHDASRFPGTGIGLATVQRVIRKHGGRIWAEAEKDRGATFFFTL